MRVELLISAMNADIDELTARMRIASDALIINQCDREGYEEKISDGHIVRMYSYNERGIGKSRNRAIEHAKGDICLFADEDIVYEDGYEERIVREFDAHPEADMLLVNIEVSAGRFTYFNTEYKRISWYNSGRYGAVSFAIRRSVLEKLNVTFSELFGGGAKYLNGEDSIFLKRLLDKKCHIYASPILVGREVSTGGSSWFKGINERFYHDRGVLYGVLYGKIMARVFGLRWLMVGKNVRTDEISLPLAYRYLKSGIAEGCELGE